ncbi:hypothetical protein [Niabella drilacis]|uniref:Uncharacterized protein n=1 Tax=Niabella drilacis (strain DSM 25811 / CCM 8410 / CCUG 62505 / LMG 26954 / E90) TaxID=1285928 RepID=A0A1G7BVQ2_NIADE|nr:hypothetical protein [Niabella drilacis]SDE31191.1 hypothetical protein SAMN04487894_13414 [Niabella drilacis]
MTTQQIIESFGQGKTGNCVSIAVIKAGIQIFGLDNVVIFEPTNKNGYLFFMKDGFESTLSEDELKTTIDGSKFTCLQDKKVFDYANLCFSAMAKRALVEKHEGASTIKNAVAALNNGENYHKGAAWIGLRHYKREVGLKYVMNYRGIVGASRKHCFFCSEGVVDHWGKPDKINLIARIKYSTYNYYRIAQDPIY